MDIIPSFLETNYDVIWKSLIRPPRDNYTLNDLGKDHFILNSMNFKRTDLTLKNNKKQRLKCSYWEPFDEERPCARLPVVVYLPGNSSSRVEAVPLLSYLLPMNITVFAFDFSGSGQSDGEYISLGYYEKDDVTTVLKYLKQTNKVSTIGLWGRSMGAVTALFTAANSPISISAIVVDSAFSSLTTLIDEYVHKSFPLVPQFMVNIVKKIVSDIIYKKVGFHINEINPIEVVEKCSSVPAFFCHAVNDTFIKNEHCKALFSKYTGEKEMIMFDGDHNSKRPYHVLQVISLFFYDRLGGDNLDELSELCDNNGKKSFSDKETDDVDNENYVYSSVKSIKAGMNMFNTNNE